MIESRKTHPLYKKSYVWSKKYLAQDDLGVKLGDIVEVVKVRPISKRKHWKITKVVGKDFIALGEEAMKEVAEEAIGEVMPEEEEQSGEKIVTSLEKDQVGKGKTESKGIAKEVKEEPKGQDRSEKKSKKSRKEGMPG